MPTSSGTIFRGVYNATSEDMAKLQLAINYLEQDYQGTQLFNDLSARQRDIVIIHDGQNRYEQNSVTGEGTIYWDPDKAIEAFDANGNFIGYESAAANLAHESSHATDPNYIDNTKVIDSQYDRLADRVAIERTNSIVQPLGEVTRSDHGGQVVGLSNPTLHTDGGYWVEMNTAGTIESSQNYNTFNNDWTLPDEPSYDPDEPIGDPWYDDGGYSYGGYYSAATNGGYAGKAPANVKKLLDKSEDGTEGVAEHKNNVVRNSSLIGVSPELTQSEHGARIPKTDQAIIQSLIQSMSSIGSGQLTDVGVTQRHQEIALHLYAPNAHRGFDKEY